MKAELLDVFARQKFDRYVALERRLQFLAKYLEFALPVSPIETVSDCVDIKDNMILECALEINADLILSGDDHLLRMHPWRGVNILTPTQYLALQSPDDLL